MDIITNNPYRYLGVYSNSPTKERVANKGKMNAFLKVGKSVSFPLDIPSLLPAIERTIETVAHAESELTLPMDQIRFAQFWWMNTTPLDKIAFNHLTSGNIEMAKTIWDKKDNVSSLQNRFVLSVINNDLNEAIKYAESLYTCFSDEFISSVVGDSMILSTPLWQMLIDSFVNEKVDILPFIDILENEEWKNYISEKTILPLIDELSHAIDSAKSSRGNGPESRLKAGQKLMSSTKSTLSQLRKCLKKSDIRYQTIVDKLATEILQCGIDYYNDSDDDDCAITAMKLQKYALTISVGNMAKQRCKENVDILQKVIDNLPPAEVMANHKSIQSFLTFFAIQPELISFSIQLLKDCAPHILKIKEKLGKTHPYYLKISTSIVNNALNNIIAEVNKAQNEDFNALKTALISAWRAQLYMDKFDLEPEYKKGRYQECRDALHKIISDCKGFDKPMLSIMYKYGCGWCNDLDVSDLDLQTEEECYQSCCDLTSYSTYLNKYPSGKYSIQVKSKIEMLTFQAAKTIAALEKFVQQYPHSKYVIQAKKNIEELRFNGCKTISDFQKFISDFPNSDFVPKAQDEMNKLIREENERKVRMAQQEKSLSTCKTTNDVVALYELDKANIVEPYKFSSVAYELAKNEDDYQRVISIFGIRSTGGQKAKAKVDEITKYKKEKAEARSKMLKRIIWVSILLFILLAIYLFWGIRGFAVGCTIVAFLSGCMAIGAMGDNNGSCGMILVCAAIAALFGVSAVGLYELADSIENETKSKKLYEQIINNPSEETCKDYIQRFSNTDAANNVRSIWLSLLLDYSRDFDYDSFEGASNSASLSSDTPIKKLQEFISKNEGTVYSNKAQSVMESICDSLYRVADNKSTESAWIQYQKLVPTDYFKDSEEKIENITNENWDTESKAWQMALSENTIFAYKKYQSLYPDGAHIDLCEKKLIDLEVSRVYAGEHGALPQMDRTGYGGGSTSYITVTNNTSYTLTLLYSGPDSKRVVIFSGGTSSVILKNGDYRVAASVSASNVRNYAGNENLQGGNYTVSYYISPYRD